MEKSRVTFCLVCLTCETLKSRWQLGSERTGLAFSGGTGLGLGVQDSLPHRALQGGGRRDPWPQKMFRPLMGGAPSSTIKRKLLTVAGEFVDLTGR